MILCLLIPVSAVSASDINNTAADNQVLSATPNVDTLSANVNNGENSNDTLSVNENGLLSVVENNNLLGDSNIGSSDDFSELVRLSSGTLSLYQNFYFDSTVTISKSIVIEGNGYSISGGDTTFFNINAKDVVLSNLNFKNISTSNYLIYWNGDNGNMNTVSFDNITANFINWKGNDGEITNLNFTNIGIIGNNILYSAGDNLNMKNIYIENNTISRIVVTGSNCRLDNLVNRNSAGGLMCSLSGDNLTFINSDLVNARFTTINSLNFINSTNVNLTSGMFDIVEGGFLNVVGSNFTNITSLARGIRTFTYFDNIKVNGSSKYDFTYNTDDNYALIGIKDYFTIRDSVFTNIHPNNQYHYMFHGGVQLYNCNITNSSGRFVNQNYAGGDYGILLNNTTVRDNKFNIFASNTFAYAAYDNCRIINNTFNQYTVSYDNFLMNNTVVANNTINGNYVLGLNSNRVVIVNSNFTNNSGFKNDVMFIKGTNEYHGNSLTLNKMDTGVVNNNATFETEENNWKVSMKLYANATGGKDGLNNQSRCSLEYAINNIFYGGTIFLQPDVYDNDGKKYKIVSNLVGEKENGVIFNKGGYQFYQYQGKIENITFENLTSSKQPKPTDYFGIMFFSPEIVVNNCTFNKFVGSSIFYMDYYSSRGNQLINITLIESTLSGPILGRSYDARNAYIGMDNIYDGIRMYNSNETGTEFILALHNNVIIKNCDFINSDFDSSIIHMNQIGTDFITSVDTINITDKSSFKNIILNNKGNCIGNNIFVEDSTGEGTNYLFEGPRLRLDTVNVVNVHESNGIFNFKDNLSSIDNINVNDSIFNYFLATYDKDLKNIHLNNVSLKSLILTDNVNSYNYLNFTNVTFDNTDNVTFVLNRGNVLSDCVFDNVTGGHIVVDGSTVSVLDSSFMNCNNTGLNGSVFYVKTRSDYFKVSDCSFLNNSADYGGAIYIEPDVLRSRYYNITFENNTAKIIPDGDIYTHNVSSNNTGGAIYFEEYLKDDGTWSEHVVTHDEYTWGTINWTSYYFNNIHGNLAELLSDVYVVLYPGDWDPYGDGPSRGDAMTYDNAGSLYRAFSIAGDGAVFHFVNASEVYDFSNMSWISPNFDPDILVPDVNSIDVVSDNLTFMGNNTTISHLGFKIFANRSVAVYNITFSDFPGTVFVVNGTATLENCVFINNRNETSEYGAVEVNGDNTRFINVTFKNNYNLGVGGGLYINASNVTVDYCKFVNNSASNGGHLFVSLGCEFITINNTSFEKVGLSNNAVVLNGGNQFNLVDCNFTDNNNGNALSVTGNYIYLNIVGNRFIDNKGTYSAFMISDLAGGQNIPINIVDNNFTGNNATDGGALYIKNIITPNVLVLLGNNFTGNNATDGGALYIDSEGIVFNNGLFQANNAKCGGAAYINKNGTVFNDCDFIANTANTSESFGSAIYVVDFTRVTVNGGKFDLNHVYGEDGNRKRADLSYEGILPSISATTIWTGNPYPQYANNRSSIVYYDMVYVSLINRGQGYSNETATLIENVLDHMLPNGIIIICDDDYTINETIASMIKNANLINVTIVGLTNKTTLKKQDTSEGKYLFNPPKKIKNLSLNNYLSS